MGNVQKNVFQWHKKSQLITFNHKRLENKTKTIRQFIFVEDECAVSSFQLLKDILLNQKNFCIYPQSFSSMINEKLLLDKQFKEPCLITLSAGSQGKPKGILRLQKTWLKSIAENSRRYQLDEKDSFGILGKLSHSLSLYGAVEAANIGADIHVLTDLRPNKQRQAIDDLNTSVLYATPTQLRLLCDASLLSERPNKTVRYIFSGGGKLDHTTKQHLTTLFSHANVIEFYGAAETSFISMSDEQTPIGSVGKAYPQVKLKIEKEDASSFGKIWVKSPYVFSQYIGFDEEKDKPLSLDENEGYISLNEYGYLDKDDYLFLSGRNTRRVNIADQLVFPEEIENYLQEQEGIHMCAVLPVDDEKRGKVLIAVVSLSSKILNSAKEKNDWVQSVHKKLRQKFGNLKAPKSIRIMSALPLLHSGKVDLVVLSKQIEKEYLVP